MKFKLNKKQLHANNLLQGDAKHILLYGGSRSGKTFLFVRAILIRALKHPSRHAILRFRFNHVKNSVVHDTLPKVLGMEPTFKALPEWPKGLDKSDWFYALPNGSKIWFGGLDDKERTEKILGQEYATVFLNECSQIPWASRNVAMTRLAQKTPLKLKAYYDENPPSQGHWTYRLFVQKRAPDTRRPIQSPDDYAIFGPINARDNIENLGDGYTSVFSEMSAKERLRFEEGQFGAIGDNALWTPELIEQQRFDGGELPDMQRVVVAIDPSGAAGPEETRSDETGIIVCGLGTDGKGYVLEDASGRFGPEQWGTIALSAYDRHQADAIVGEVNFGGAMVGEVIRAAAASAGIERPKFVEVRASRGKVIRAEPIATLFETQKVYIAGHFPALEDQLMAMTTAGYTGDRSPDRGDAMIWGLAHLFPGLTRRTDGEFRRVPKAVLAYEAQKQYRRPRAITRRTY